MKAKRPLARRRTQVVNMKKRALLASDDEQPQRKRVRFLANDSGLAESDDSVSSAHDSDSYESASSDSDNDVSTDTSDSDNESSEECKNDKIL